MNEPNYEAMKAENDRLRAENDRLRQALMIEQAARMREIKEHREELAAAERFLREKLGGRPSA